MSPQNRFGFCCPQITQIFADFKKAGIRNADTMAAEKVAFSKGEGGCLLLGVANDGDICGLRNIHCW